MFALGKMKIDRLANTPADHSGRLPVCDNALNAGGIAIDAEPCRVAPVVLLERKILTETPVWVVEKKTGMSPCIDDMYITTNIGLHLIVKERLHLVSASIGVVEAEVNHPETLQSSGQCKPLFGSYVKDKGPLTSLKILIVLLDLPNVAP